MNEEAIRAVKKRIEDSRNPVFLTGAGVSVLSGIPDFRSQDGLYSRAYRGMSPEEILSADLFEKDPRLFWKFFREKIWRDDAEPNIVHRYIASLETPQRTVTVITQNIDGLHQKAGSSRVLEIHGNMHTAHCTKCRKAYGRGYLDRSGEIPRCTCGGVLHPDIILYGEYYDHALYKKAADAAWDADVMVVAGSSLAVATAADLIRYYQGDHLIILNRDRTAYDSWAETVIHEDFRDVFRILAE